MSSGIQQKMYDYEVAPPTAVWEKIAAELDESELTKKISSRLYNIQVAPPANAWQRIAASLEGSPLANDFADKLSGIEITPPARTWNQIQTILNSEQEAAVPEHRRFSPFIKYAAAAAIIGFLTWGGFQLYNNNADKTEIVKQETISPKENTVINQPAIIPDENIGNADVAAALDEARNDAALEASKKTYAKLDVISKKSKIKNVADFFFAADSDEPTGTRGMGNNPDETAYTNISNRYIMLMTPDGNIIRMSKKLSNLVCCVSGEEMDKDCLDQMKKWREKIATPSKNHSPGNFMDILSLVNSLQDN